MVAFIIVLFIVASLLLLMRVYHGISSLSIILANVTPTDILLLQYINMIFLLLFFVVVVCFEICPNNTYDDDINK